MDPQAAFCPNPGCPARGQGGQGNISVHSRKDRRYKCRVCGKTFVARTASTFYRLRTDERLVSCVVALLAHGCPVQAIVAAYELDERTVLDWQRRAGHHCQRLHACVVEQPRDLGQVQADELRVRIQGGVVWLAMALQVSTRLWLGASVSGQRDAALLVALLGHVRSAAQCRPLLLCTDGFIGYLAAIRRTFRTRLPRRGSAGSPLSQPWPDVYIAQVVKQKVGRMVIGIERRLVQGTAPRISLLLARTQVGGGINTAYIERLNATFRSHLSHLVRRSRTLARHTTTLQAATFLVGTVYNFCTHHESLRLPGTSGILKWQPHTPAMAAGLAHQRWSVHQLLAYPIPLPRWVPPLQNRRGRRTKAMEALIARWCS